MTINDLDSIDKMNEHRIANNKQKKKTNCVDRNKKTWDVTTNVINKLYGFVFDKRILFNDLTTVPFGYCE